MPSEKVLEQKKKAVAEIVDKLNNSVSGVLVEYSGVSVADDTALRKELREAGVDYSVVKNTLLSRAAEQAGLDDLKDVLSGTTALATSKEDHAAPARITKKFAKDHEGYKIKSGYLDGKVVDLDTINQLADLPTYDVLMSTVCAALDAPISAFARVIQAVVDKKNEEGDGEAEALAAEAEAPAADAAPAE